MLSTAFNALTRLHSRPAMLKRLGTPDIFSLIRLTPANYFRFLRGPEYTTVKGVEFVIPLAVIVGHVAQKLSFSKVPDAGTFKIGFGVLTTGSLAFNASAADIQTALRLLSGLSNVVVTGNYSAGFILTFVGSSSPVTIGDVTESTLVNGVTAVTDTWVRTNTPWDKPLLKGDRIIDGSNQWAIDEIIEMYDLGAIIMGYRIRAD